MAALYTWNNLRLSKQKSSDMSNGISDVVADESVGPPSSKRAKLSDSSINDDQVQLITNEEQFDNETDGKKKYPPEYPPYYHENFKIVLHDVLSGVDSRGILIQEEKDFVAKFSTLSGDE